MKIAHVLNITDIDERKKKSHLHIAQPVTMRTMLEAQKKATVSVDLYSIKHVSEKVESLEGFDTLPDLTRYACDLEYLKNENLKLPLPILADILDSLFQNSDADYYIYTNVDIGLYPNFYNRVAEIINSGYDCFCINRREFKKEYNNILIDESNYNLIYAQDSKKHPGHDCFVFKNSLLPKLNLGSTFVGFPPIGRVLRTQLKNHSKNFKTFKDEYLTFHLGEDRAWDNKTHPYYVENMKNSQKSLRKASSFKRFLNKFK